jgi:hypothetical protein
MKESLDRAGSDRHAFDPDDPATWPEGMWRYVGANVTTAQDRIDAYRAWREDQRQDRIVDALARLSATGRPSPAPAQDAPPSAVATSPADDGWITIKAAAKMRGLGQAAIKRAIRSGELEGECPERNGGRAYRVRPSCLMAWTPTSGRRTKPTVPAPGKRATAIDDQPRELRALGLRFVKDGE